MIAPRRVAFCRSDSIGTPEDLSPLNGWPTRTPVNASPVPRGHSTH